MALYINREPSILLPMTSQTVFRLKETTGPSGLIKLEEPIPSPRAHEVLVRIHAVSLNYRDHVISIGAYPMGTKKDVVPFSDMAGEVVALGEDTRDFKIGDRVTANFDLFHYFGRKSSHDGDCTHSIRLWLSLIKITHVQGLLVRLLMAFCKNTVFSTRRASFTFLLI